MLALFHFNDTDNVKLCQSKLQKELSMKQGLFNVKSFFWEQSFGICKIRSKCFEEN